MNRVYTRESYLELVDSLYREIPDLALSTDIIVGFPGETEADFEATMDVVRHARFDQAFTFIYSPREGTPAASMPIPGAPRCDAGPLRPAGGTRSQLRAREGPRPRGNRTDGVVRGCEQARRRSSSRAALRETRSFTSRLPEGRSADEYAGRILDVRIDEAQTWFLTGSLGTNH